MWENYPGVEPGAVFFFLVDGLRPSPWGTFYWGGEGNFFKKMCIYGESAAARAAMVVAAAPAAAALLLRPPPLSSS